MTSTAVERIQAEDLQHRQVLNRTLATADVMAASSLVRADLRNKPENVRAIAITLHQYGLPVGIQNINACYVVNGKVEFMTHLWTGLAMRYGGHEVWVCDADSQKCNCEAPSSSTEGRAHIRRGDSGQLYTATFSWEQAKTAGLIDSPTYKKFPTDMLGWRALSRAIKRYAPEIVSGLADAGEPTISRAAPRPVPGHPEYDHETLIAAAEQKDDDDITDAEIAEPEQGEDVVMPGHATVAPPGPTPDPEKWAAFVRWTEAGEPRDENGYPVDAPPAAAAQEPEPKAEADRPPAFLPRLATGGVDWRDACKRYGVTQADLLRQAQEFSRGRALPVPETLAEITDEQVQADLADWLAE